MQALIVVDAQNEFSPRGKRSVPNHGAALAAIARWVDHARADGLPIAWVRHHNRPGESTAFVPGSWGAELCPGLGPWADSDDECLFEKDVFGAFTGTGLDEWLKSRDVGQVTIVGFYAHMCVSTSVREALVRGYAVSLDADATGACDLEDERLGGQTADEVRRSAFLQLMHMGAWLVETPDAPERRGTPTQRTAPCL